MIPRSRARRRRSATGKTIAVVDVMWLMESTFVRGVTADQTDSTNVSAGPMGRGIACRTYLAPRLAQTNAQVRSMAPYSWSVEITSSPGPSRTERATALSAVVALGKNARSSASAPTNSPSSARAVRINPSNLRPRNSTGCRSSSRCHAW
jgi:hypothetical protein